MREWISGSCCRSLRALIVGTLLCLFPAGCALLRPPPPDTPPPAPCAFVNGSLRIDGVMEAAWLAAPALSAFRLPGSEDMPESRTEVRLLWDHDNLYVFFTARDRDIMGYEEERDSFTFNDDVLEVFLKPDSNGEGYCNFEINVLQTVYDAFVPRERMPMERRWRQWNCKGLKTGTKIRGTLNDYTDEDDLWTLELAIPFRSLPPCDGEPPQPGDTWSVLFARYDYSVYLEDGRELSASSQLSRPTFHATDEYGLMRFVRP